MVTLSLLNDYIIEIGNGLGELAGKVWRIGLMSFNSRPDNLELVTMAQGRTLKRCSFLFSDLLQERFFDYQSETRFLWQVEHTVTEFHPVFKEVHDGGHEVCIDKLYERTEVGNRAAQVNSRCSTQGGFGIVGSQGLM